MISEEEQGDDGLISEVDKPKEAPTPAAAPRALALPDARDLRVRRLKIGSENHRDTEGTEVGI